MRGNPGKLKYMPTNILALADSPALWGKVREARDFLLYYLLHDTAYVINQQSNPIMAGKKASASTPTLPPQQIQELCFNIDGRASKLPNVFGEGFQYVLVRAVSNTAMKNPQRLG